MRLHSMLTLPGGNPEQGRPIALRLRYRGPGGVPYTRDVSAFMLPISAVEELAARRASQEPPPVAPGGETMAPQLPEGAEYVVQFLARCLRDPANPAEHLCSDPRDLQALRDGLVGPQYRALLLEYRSMMASEYPEVVTEDDVEDMKGQARDFSDGEKLPRS